MNKCEKFVRIILHTIKDKSLKLLFLNGGRYMTRTCDPLLVRETLYQLS